MITIISFILYLGSSFIFILFFISFISFSFIFNWFFKLFISSFNFFNSLLFIWLFCIFDIILFDLVNSSFNLLFSFLYLSNSFFNVFISFKYSCLILFNSSLNFLFSSSNFLILRFSSFDLFCNMLLSFLYFGIKSRNVFDWCYKIKKIIIIHAKK